MPSRPASAVTTPRTVTIEPTGRARAAAIVIPSAMGSGMATRWASGSQSASDSGPVSAPGRSWATETGRLRAWASGSGSEARRSRGRSRRHVQPIALGTRCPMLSRCPSGPVAVTVEPIGELADPPSATGVTIDPDRAGSIVDRDGGPVGERVRAVDDRRRSSRMPDSLDEFAGAPGREAGAAGKAGTAGHDDVGLRRSQRPLGEPVVDRARGRRSWPRSAIGRDDGRVEVEGDPAGRVLDERRPPGLQGAEIGRQHARDRDRRAVGHAIGRRRSSIGAGVGVGVGSASASASGRRVGSASGGSGSGRASPWVRRGL